MKNLTFLTAILIASLSFAQVPTYVPTNGLVGWWPFNGNANDESGNGNNGTVNGAMLTSDRNGVINSAYSFDGVDDFINGIIISYPTNNISISVWIKHNTGITDCCDWTKKQTIVSIGSPFSDNATTFEAQENSSLIRYGSWGSTISGSITMGIDWDMYTIVYNGINYIIYKNSVEQVNYTSILNINSGNFVFGRQFGGFENFWNGKLDDIGIWNRSLTACEIKNLYNGGVPNSSQAQTALDTYTWPVNNQTYTQSGTYSDTLMNAAGCDSIVTLNLTLNYTGLNELSTSTIVISPNPTNGDFTLTGLELFNTISSMTIKDVNGKTIKELDPKTAKFSLGTVKAGVYFLTITAGNKQEVIKIIKE